MASGSLTTFKATAVSDTEFVNVTIDRLSGRLLKVSREAREALDYNDKEWKRFVEDVTREFISEAYGVKIDRFNVAITWEGKL